MSTIKKQFIEKLLQGNRKACSEIIQQQAAQHVPINEIYDNLLREAMYHVGELWESNQISVATEHLASMIVESILVELYPAILSDTQLGKKVVLACVASEQHQIAIKMVNDVFELQGWQTYNLGANTPTTELIHFIGQVSPQVVALSLSIYFHLPELLQLIEHIHATHPTIPILVGGQAFRHGGLDVLADFENVLFAENLSALEQLIKHTLA